ncbi:helix-turn-helix domain-containing protein [Paenibacillus motobuensis]|uniref:helix-turn-helix domain-containing protein n=1 Tax=Paenibacillus motobuensis TaxID=295324 RepID=UPI003635FBCA
MIKVTPRLNEILKERDITQLQLAAMSGVPQPSISRFDKNTRHEAVHLFAISCALGVSIEELFRVDDSE